MKLFATCITLLLAVTATAQEPTPPAFDGMTVRFFAARLSARTADAAIQEEIPFDSLSPRVCIAFRVDTTGAVSRLRLMDNTLTGRDSCNLPPATEATRRLVERTFEGMDGVWTPAERNGRKIRYVVRTYLNIPVEEIARRQGVEPLKFLGGDPQQSFYDWARVRIRYDERHAVRRAEGIYRVRFFIEADGTLTLDDVLVKNDDKLLREVIRVIRNSAGKWTPRKVRGVPVRSEFVFGMNFL